MKANLLAAFLFITVAASAQYTQIPDINFENKLIALGIDSGTPDGKVLTDNIKSVPVLFVGESNIYNLTGIEGFASLTVLDCHDNKLTTLDVSKNMALTSLSCSANQLTTLDVSKNIALNGLYCDSNALTTLDVSNNMALVVLDFSSNTLTTIDVSMCTALKSLKCSSNQLTTLDVSKNTNLAYLYCSYNKITSLNLKNAANTTLTTVDFKNNPNLTCIQVDDVAYSNTNWSSAKDATANFSTNCPTAVSGINKIVFEKISIYPNPTKGELHIDNVNLENATVYDASGKTLQTASFNTTSDKNIMTLSGLSKGVYYIFIEAQGAQTTEKIVIE